MGTFPSVPQFQWRTRLHPAPTATRRADIRGLDAPGDQHVLGPPGDTSAAEQQWIGTGVRDRR